jgi:diadenylate cyclase
LASFFDNLFFIFQRFSWESLFDILLVTIIFWTILIFIQNTRAAILARGIIVLIILVYIATALFDLPAFSWLLNNILPALLFAVPVIFAPEIRRGLEQLGKAGKGILNRQYQLSPADEIVSVFINAATRLSLRKHGALIIFQNTDSLAEYISTGVDLDANITVDLLLQIFFPNTPLHDGGVIISDNKIVAASCVMPLSASGVLSASSDRKMGLRHRAALGSSEVSDCIALIVSEETGAISAAVDGKMQYRLDRQSLDKLLRSVYSTESSKDGIEGFINRIFSGRQLIEPKNSDSLSRDEK